MLKFKLIEANKIKKAEIVFFLPYYHTGGAEKVHLNIVKALNKYECCIIFTHLSSSNNFYEDFKKNAQIIEINSIRNKKSNFLLQELEKYILSSLNNSKNVQSVFGCNTDYFYQILPKISYKIKRIDLIHALSENDKRSKVLANSSNFISSRVCINKKGKEDLFSIYNFYNIDSELKNNVKIIENGVEIPRNESLELKEANKIKLGFIGRWSEEKRPEIFLEVAKTIKKKYSNIQFVMAGSGMKSNLKQINESGVIFLDEIKNEKKLNQLYRSLTGVIISSVYEGFPMVIMESMIFGVIPFSTDVGGISEHIKHLENGVLIESRKDNQLVEDFVKQITFLINNKAQREALSNNARSYGVNTFSIENFNNKYQELFK